MTDDLTPVGFPPQRVRKRRGLVFAGIAAFLLLTSGGALAWIASRDAPAPAPTSGSPNTFRIVGYLTLDEGGYQWTDGDACTGKGGFDDISIGTQVVISDAAGTTIALGKLDRGRTVIQGCSFPFTIDGVPKGHDFYGVAIGRRGRLQYTPEQLQSSLKLQLR